jgi:hypothetical protein
LEIDVKVRCASILTISSVSCVDKTILVTKVIIICVIRITRTFLTTRSVSNCITALMVGVGTSVIIDLWADCIALGVLCGAPLAETVARVMALSLEFCICGAGKEDLQVTLDLFSGRPIDLAILLGTFHTLDLCMVLGNTSCSATGGVNLACQVAAVVVSTDFALKLALGHITRCIFLDVSMIC